MKNHRFLWLRNRTTDNRKCEKARNIKEKRTIEMFSTVSKPHVALRSSANDNSTEYRKRATNPENPVFSGFSLCSKNLSDTLKTHKNCYCLCCFLIACAKAIVQLLSADYKNIKNFVIVGKGRFLMIPKESIDTLETSGNSTMVYDTMTM